MKSQSWGKKGLKAEKWQLEKISSGMTAAEEPQGDKIPGNSWIL